jgi:nucleotide-binding universal stress UspA family protein
VRSHTRAEPPAQALGAIAACEAARIVVVGAQHRQRLRLRPSGSVAAQLARHAPCPVIVVPAVTTDAQARPGETDALRLA